MLSELLYADDLVQMSEPIKGHRNKFLKWSNSLKVNLGKTKVMVSGGIAKEGMSKRKHVPSGVCI